MVGEEETCGILTCGMNNLYSKHQLTNRFAKPHAPHKFNPKHLHVDPPSLHV